MLRVAACTDLTKAIGAGSGRPADNNGALSGRILAQVQRMHFRLGTTIDCTGEPKHDARTTDPNGIDSRSIQCSGR